MLLRDTPERVFEALHDKTQSIAAIYEFLELNLSLKSDLVSNVGCAPWVSARFYD
jgi:hypothetical protein